MKAGDSINVDKPYSQPAAPINTDVYEMFRIPIVDVRFKT